MEKEKKKNGGLNNTLIIIILAIILLVAAGIGIFTSMNGSKKNNKTKEDKQEVQYNTNEDVVKDKEVNGILFTNIKCSYDGNMSLITYTIVNHTGETINLKEYEVMVRDKDGNLLAVIAPNLDEDIAPEASVDAGNAINIDLSNAFSMELNLDSAE